MSQQEKLQLKKIKSEYRYKYFSLRQQGFTHQLALDAVIEEMWIRYESVLQRLETPK